MIEIRQATQEDAAPLALLRHQCLIHNGHPALAAAALDAYVTSYRRFVDFALSNNTWTIWTGRDEGIRIAVYIILIAGSPMPNALPARFGIISQLDVDPHRELDSQLLLVLRRVVAWCREQKLQRLHLAPGLNAVKPHFETIGFKQNMHVSSLSLE